MRRLCAFLIRACKCVQKKTKKVQIQTERVNDFVHIDDGV